MLRKLLIVESLLLISLISGCFSTTKYIKTPPCLISQFPKAPRIVGYQCYQGKVESICYSVKDDFEVTKFLEQVLRWRNEVRSCLSVSESTEFTESK
jgi:hypothetical protein